MSSIRKDRTDSAKSDPGLERTKLKIRVRQDRIAQLERDLASTKAADDLEAIKTELERLLGELAELRAAETATEEADETDAVMDLGPAQAATPAPTTGDSSDGAKIELLRTMLEDGRAEFDRYRANSEAIIESLKAENAKLAAEANEHKDRFLRARAELENVVRRTEREKADISRFAISDFARDVLGIGDNIDRAISHVPAEAAAGDSALASFLEGVELLKRELHAMLERYGVVRMEPLGERFDPNQHQAVMEQEAPDVPAGTIVQVLQAGYAIAERVLRPAIVVVAKGGAKPGKQAEPPTPANDPAPAQTPDFGEPSPGSQS